MPGTGKAGQGGRATRPGFLVVITVDATVIRL